MVLFGKVLPCNLCRDSYSAFVKKLPLTDRVMSSRKNLVGWLFKIHNMVNKKLNCKVLNTKQLTKKMKFYEKFRAVKCSKDLGGCMKSAASVKIPKRTKVITFVDETALNLRLQDQKKAKRSKVTSKRKKTSKSK